jgi:hypothetical protein
MWQAVQELALAFCDCCGAPLRFGDWYHKRGAGFDLCKVRFCMCS